MPVILTILLLGVFAYLYWKRKTTTLTRNCRWRENRRAGHWDCAFCGARVEGATAPKDCKAGARN
ncbi:hypothetical protein KMP13_19855 [Epibacterium ulvae]|uniref:hypothetical protein n=1 Tax=Epibacterium ulvae TaxID=1156985 RepID=UPI001BFC118A|nr:hypothetical protein [Epibacterium ulvae]MBT8156072.1 hypothetical protein [Epibacterium ulvae]